MAHPNKPAKTMSSRLLDMKFMQRAAASSPASAPSTPSEPSSKRQRLSNGTYSASPPRQPKDDRSSEDAASSEPSKRDEDAEFEGANRGETKWYLSVKQKSTPTAVKAPLRIVSAGFGALDAAQPPSSRSDGEDNDLKGTSEIQGRRSFGNFNRKVEKQQDPKASGHDSASASDHSHSEEYGEEKSDEDEEESHDPTGLNTMLADARQKAIDQARTRRETKRKEAGADSTLSAAERRKKRVKLNDTTSPADRPPKKPSIPGPCFKCGRKEGHPGIRYCPKSKFSWNSKDSPR